MKYYVGIDLGGTNTKIGLVDEKGNIIFTTIVKTDSMEGFSETIQRLSKILITQIEGTNVNFDDVVSVGVGVPGPVLNSRVVKFWANFPWKHGVDLALEFEKNLGKPVKVDNDVNVERFCTRI